MNRRLLVNNDFILHSLLGKLTISLIIQPKDGGSEEDWYVHGTERGLKFRRSERMISRT